MARKIVGSVYWIENARQTSRIVDVEEAFSDYAQAKAQILYAESSGDKRQLRLARLAYRQFQEKRYREESKAEPRTAAEVDQKKISKRPRKKPSKAKSQKVQTKRKVATKVPAKLVSKPAKRKPSKSVSKVPVARMVKPTRGKRPETKPSKKPMVKRAERKATSKVGSKPSKGKLSMGKSQKEPTRKPVAKRSAKVASKPPRSKSLEAKSSKTPAGTSVSRKVASWLTSAFSRRKPSEGKSSRKLPAKRVGEKATVKKAEKKPSNRK